MKNYHTHTVRCHHAMNSEKEYIDAAIKAGYTTLGFSDHSPWHYQSGFIPTMRMQDFELDEYVLVLRKLQEQYKNQIEIKIGLEVEYFEDKIPWLKEQIEKYELDYCILGHHFYQTDEGGKYYGYPLSSDDLVNYVDGCIAGMESGLFSYLAHPDLPNYNTDDPFYSIQMRRICLKAKELDIPLEFNILGYTTKRHYPNDTFFSIVKEVGNKVIIGVDAHEAKSLDNFDEYHKVKKALLDSELEVVDTIKYLR